MNNMQIVGKIKYLRIAPRKVRLVADLLKGRKIEDAQNILNFTSNKAALPFSKLLKQTLSNAKNNFQLQESGLFISKILVDEGPKLKRVFPRSRGRAEQIHKKTSHITLFLEQFKKAEPKEKVKREKVHPVKPSARGGGAARKQQFNKAKDKVKK